MSKSQVSYHRSPCPGRIFEDLGVGFSIGVIAGSSWYFLRGKYTFQAMHPCHHYSHYLTAPFYFRHLECPSRPKTPGWSPPRSQPCPLPGWLLRHVGRGLQLDRLPYDLPETKRRSLQRHSLRLPHRRHLGHPWRSLSRIQERVHRRCDSHAH